MGSGNASGTKGITGRVINRMNPPLRVQLLEDEPSSPHLIVTLSPRITSGGSPLKAVKLGFAETPMSMVVSGQTMSSFLCIFQSASWQLLEQ